MTEQVHQPAAELVIDQNSNHLVGGSSLLFVLSAVAAVLFCFFLFLYNYTLTKSVSNYDNQRSSIISQIETPDNQKLEKTINSTASTISNLKNLIATDSYKTSDLLVNFPKLVTKNAQLNNLSLDENNNLRIDGQTDTMTTLAVFIQSLNDSEYLENTDLVSVVTENLNGKNVTKFSISCLLNKDKAKAAQNIDKTTTTSTGNAPESSTSDSTSTEASTDTSTEAPYAAPAP